MRKAFDYGLLLLIGTKRGGEENVYSPRKSHGFGYQYDHEENRTQMCGFFATSAMFALKTLATKLKKMIRVSQLDQCSEF